MSRFTTPRHALTTVALVAVTALTLTGCTAPDAAAPDDGKITVVASTSVYGNLVSTLGGDAVTVTSLINSAAQDPHSFEASARDQLAVSRADLIILNGGGYDPFAEALYESSGASAVLVNAVDASGLLTADHEDSTAEAEEPANDAEAEHTTDDGHDHITGFNEHVWYSFHAVEHIAEHITDELIALAPASQASFEENLNGFLLQLTELDDRAAAIAATANGRSAAVTEPVAVYLLEAVGLHDDTPTAFTEAIEEGSDVAPTALRDVLELVSSGRAALLAYNQQTASAETERVREAAVEAGLAVVSFTETLPDGSDYVTWMTANLDAIDAAIVG
ncbi:MAG: metal ABC transporter solute-binding protein, Zn/Mn family [Rhodoglobus sp.]